jgi:hypothetical protein
LYVSTHTRSCSKDDATWRDDGIICGLNTSPVFNTDDSIVFDMPSATAIACPLVQSTMICATEKPDETGAISASIRMTLIGVKNP